MALDLYTELFDLFGEEGFCSVCQEDLKEGERIRTLRRCQHLFHAACLEPWILEHASCPMCRTTMGSVTLLDNFNTIMVALQTRIQEERIRRYYTYALWDGIRRKNPTAALFNENKVTIDLYVSEDTFSQENIIIAERSFRNRNHFQREYLNLRSTIYESGTLAEQALALTLWPGIQEARERFRTFAETRADFNRIWS